ncbi:hypothetical protein VNO77_15708 [Canavalia gladiata]|uniref:Uncharacterized protein n=1 Tax=Canavalia gladiata TaxID=3824 RepID=A0AAN9M2Y0_CANGL
MLGPSLRAQTLPSLILSTTYGSDQQGVVDTFSHRGSLYTNCGQNLMRCSSKPQELVLHQWLPKSLFSRESDIDLPECIHPWLNLGRFRKP